MNIKPVIDNQAENDFLNFPISLYKDNPNWIRPLDKDINIVFDIKKNTVAQKDNFMRWLLIEDDRIVGRIAAFINKKTVNKNNDYPVGGIGFFECIDSQPAADILFNTAKDWLEKQGIEAMEGPINFGERDKWWGLLVKGHKEEPNYLANYNPPYYEQLFDNYGFKLYFNQFTYRREVDVLLSDSYIEKAKFILKNPDFEFKYIDKNNIDKFTDDFRIIYNKAWARHLGVSEMKPRQAKALIKSLKPVLDPKVAWFGYHKGDPIAFFISVPEVNQIFKYINGNLNLWGKLIFLKHKILKTNNKLLGIIFGVIPDFDGKGITNAIVYKAQKTIKESTNYKYIELHGIGDFNPAMINMVKKLGDIHKTKVHRTYRYVFDRNRHYERMPFKSKK